MKKLFVAIRQNNVNAVKELIEKKPELISCTAKQPPKKDDGQSPLQVAIKSGNFEIADFLLDAGADVNFIETEGINEWKAPVIHDSVIAAVMTSRWNTNSAQFGIKVYGNKKTADKAFALLERIVALGADINEKDSHGFSVIGRAMAQARQILPRYNHVEKILLDDRILTVELKEDLLRIFNFLICSGADLDYVQPNLTRLAKDLFPNEPIMGFVQA